MIQNKSLYAAFAGLLLVISSSFAFANETSTVTETGLTVSDYSGFQAEQKVDLEKLKNTEGNEVVTETLEDGRQVVTIRSSGKKTNTPSLNALDSEKYPATTSDISNTVTLYLDSEGKLQAKSISQKVNGETTTSTEKYDGFADTFGNDYASVEHTTTDKKFFSTGTSTVKTTYKRSLRYGYVRRVTYTGTAQTTIEGSAGPVGGTVALGDDAQKEFIEAVQRESELGEGIISPITT